MSDRTRMLVVDDQKVVRDSVRAALSAHPDLEVVGEASDGTEAAGQVVATAPDVVLLDLRMPEMDGLRALEEIHANNPQVKVIAFSVLSERLCVREAFNLGATAYVVKGGGESSLADIVTQVARGSVYVDPLVRSFLMEQLRLADAEALDQEERELIGLVAGGLSDRAIGEHLGIDASAAGQRVAAVLEKLEYKEPVQRLAAELRKTVF